MVDTESSFCAIGSTTMLLQDEANTDMYSTLVFWSKEIKYN